MARIELELFAPTVASARVIGEWNGWEPQEMERGPEGAWDGVWRVRVDVEDGRWGYLFEVPTRSWFFEEGEEVRFVDPRAPEVEADGEGERGVLRVEGGERVGAPYRWEHDDAPLPPDDALTLYELHVGDLTLGEEGLENAGTFLGVVAKLDEIRDLGMNAIELMPVQAFGGGYGWGYLSRHLFAPHPAYGRPEELKRLVDEAHARGIRVILDVVLNHADTEMPLTRIDHDYWFRHEPKDPDNSWGPEYDFERWDEGLELHPARDFTEAVVRHWVSEYHVDGLRFDAAKQIGSFDAMLRLVAVAKDAAGGKPFYCVAEHIPETPEIVGVDGPMDGCWHEGFYHVVRDLLTGDAPGIEAVQDVIDPRRKGFSGPSSLVTYVANHDHDRLLEALGAAGVLDDDAFRRARFAAAMLFGVVGVPMVWMGEEFGATGPATPESSPLDRGLLANERNAALRDLYRGLAALRREQGALRTDRVEFLREDAERGLLAWHRWDDAGSRVAVVANLRDAHAGDVEIGGWPADGTWHEWTRDYDVEVEGGIATFEMPPFEVRVLSGPG